MKKVFGFALAGGTLLLAAALVLAAAGQVVIVNGGVAKVRVLMQGAEPYVSARDIAKAFGKTFQMSGGKLVFGAPGGQFAETGSTAEYGKWAFNGHLRARVKSVENNNPGCRNSIFGHTQITVDVANATSENFYVRGRVHSAESYMKTKLLGDTNSGFPIDGGIPPGSQATYNWCSQPADLVILRMEDSKKDGGPLKLKLK